MLQALRAGRVQPTDDSFQSFVSALEEVHPPFSLLRQAKSPYCSLDIVTRPNSDQEWLRIKIRYVPDVRSIISDSGGPFSEIIVGFRSSHYSSYGNPIPFVNAHTSYIYLPLTEFVNLVLPKLH